MKACIYVFKERSALIDEKDFHPIDDFLLKAMHIESIYDVLDKKVCINYSVLKDILDVNLLEKLNKTGEILIKDKEIISKLLDAADNTKSVSITEDKQPFYIVLRLEKEE